MVTIHGPLMQSSLLSCSGSLPSLPAGLLSQDAHVTALTGTDQFSSFCLPCSHPCPVTSAESDEAGLQPCLQRVSQQLLC